MMRVRDHGDLRRTHLPVVKSGGNVCSASWRPWPLPLIILVFVLMALAQPATAQQGTLSLSSAPGGIAFTVGGGGNTYSSQFGVMNALGIGAPSAGVTVIPLNNGALYITKYQVTMTGLPNPHLAAVTAFVNSNFSHPAALVVQSCPSTSACTASGNF